MMKNLFSIVVLLSLVFLLSLNSMGFLNTLSKIHAQDKKVENKDEKRLADIERRLDLLDNQLFNRAYIVSGNEKDQNVTVKYFDSSVSNYKLTKLMWIKVGNKIFLPEFITTTKEAQKIKNSELVWAWRERAIGVFKMNYNKGPVREAFKGFIVVVGSKEYDLTKEVK